MKKVKTAPAAKPYADSVNIDKLPKLHTSPLVQRVHDMVLAYEKWQTKLHGYKFVAVRTRKALVAKGAEKTVADACLIRPSPGFRAMVENKKANMTYEWIALEYPKKFDRKVLDAARTRLDMFKVKGYPGWVKPEPKAKRVSTVKGKDVGLAPNVTEQLAKPTVAELAKAAPEKKGRGWNLKGRPKKAQLATADAAE